MIIVPVIDIARGQVVHAKRGERAGYLPVKSKLCAGSKPLDIVQAFMRLDIFEVVYIADLDAITGAGNNRASIEEIHQCYPGLTLWLDNGSTSVSKSTSHPVVPVLGSETGISPRQLADISSRKTGYILSLDFTGNRLNGDDKLLQATADWPDVVIVLDLYRTGSNCGPDYSMIKHIRNLAGNRRIYWGGGISSADDLQQLAAAGCHGALLATALHNRTIDKSVITGLKGRQ